MAHRKTTFAITPMDVNTRIIGVFLCAGLKSIDCRGYGYESKSKC
jgi:hypothetical protein